MAHSSRDISRSCNQTSSRSNTSETITVTQLIPAENPMIGTTPNGNHSKYSMIIVNEPVMISLLPGISYLRGSAVPCFVNVRCSEMIKNTGALSWKVCLGLILEDREEGNWIWFSLLSGLVFGVGICVYCVWKYQTDVWNLTEWTYSRHPQN